MWRERIFSNMSKYEFCIQILILQRERERERERGKTEVRRDKKREDSLQV